MKELKSGRRERHDRGGKGWKGKREKRENRGEKEKNRGGGVYNDEDITRWDRVIHFPTLCGLCNPDYPL